MTAVIVLLAVLVVLETAKATVLVTAALAPKPDAAKATAARTENTGADEVRSGSIDEGFKNIMSFSVHGKTEVEQDE